MQKIIVSSLVIILFMLSTHAFAQFKNPIKTTKNLMNLERVVVRATKPSAVGRQIVRVPNAIIKNNQVALTSVDFPIRTISVSNNCNRLKFENWKLNSYNKLLQMPYKWISAGGKAFYTSQTQLVRDLHAFYSSNTQIRIGPDGREIKLYALPVDGILYKPVGYSKPVVLNSQDYLVIYDVASNTGQIAENTPEVYNLFEPLVYEDIWQAIEEEKIVGDTGILGDIILMAHLYQTRIKQKQMRRIVYSKL